MSDFHAEVRTIAAALAFRRFQQQNPTATRDQANAFARRGWERFVPLALDFLSLRQADAEAAAAAQWN